MEDGDKIISGHNDCAAKLIQSAASFLEKEINLDHEAQQQLLEEVEPSFTEEDNLALLKPPDKEEILQVIKKSNLLAAPGTDGITNYFYLKFFDVIGEHLSQVVKEIFNKESPTTSQKTSIMVFANKPKKMESLKIGDKRKISLLNADFKIISGIEAKRHGLIMEHTVSNLQYAAGKSRRISHAINFARDAVFAANTRKEGAALADLDFEAAFNLLCMNWVEDVLVKKGLHINVISRIKRLYTGGITIPLINDIPGRQIPNLQRTLRQSDCPSSMWFAYGIDPLLVFLERRLQGIPVYQLPVLGPNVKNKPRRLEPIVYKYTVLGYCDDVKPAIVTMEKFQIVDQGARLFEKSSGCKLHRDRSTDKCKMLLFGEWCVKSQEDFPLPFVKIVNELDMLGVKLASKYATTRSINGDILIKIIQDKMNLWKAGKFLPLTARAFSINSYVLAKVWYRTAVVDVRSGDVSRMASSIKSWIYQDQLIKPQEELLYRKTEDGGLG